MSIQRVGVVGLGTMGAGIAEVFVASGVRVVAVDVDENALAAGRSRLEKSFQRSVDKGRLTPADRADIEGRLTFTTDLDQLADAGLVIEAVPERIDLKASLFGELDRRCGPETILATNTSSLPVTRIAATTSRPQRVVGMHFFNPAPVMKLVEVVHTVLTDSAVVSTVRELAVTCGKTPVVVGDRAGFVANALLFGYLADAARLAETKQATLEDIDAAMVASCGLPMGPLTLLDLIGLDVSLDVLETLYDETRDQRYAPPPLLRRLVMAGKLGRKSSRGYYRYDDEAGQAADVVPVDDVTLVGHASGRIANALGLTDAVRPADVGDAGLVVVDGGSAAATAELLGRVATAGKPDTVVLAAAPDDMPLAAVASTTRNPEAVVGLHVPLAPRPGVVEVVTTSRSSEAAVATARALVSSRGATAVVCRDRPGQIVEALLLPHLGDAARMVGDGYATRDDVETAMRLGCGYPAGPFELLGAIGSTDVRAGLLHLAAATHQPGLAPSAYLDDIAAFGS